MIPIYRAKRNDSNKYIEGLLSKSIIGGNEAYFIESWEKHRIDISTLAIHFPDMIDSQGNKIFASLQEDGKGGDIVEYKGREYSFGYKKEYFKVGLLNFRGWQLTTSDLLKVKKIGIQE